MQVQEGSNHLENYLDSVFVLSHSKSTVKTYRSSIVLFREFLGTKHAIDEVKAIQNLKHQELDVYSLLRDFVVYLDKIGYKGSSVRVLIAAVKGYLRYYGIKIYAEDCKHTVRIPKSVVSREEPLTKDLLVRLLRNLNPKLQTVVLVAVSSGMRIGEIAQLKIDDVDFDCRPVKIRIRAETTKTKESRETFLTEETTNSLKDYLKRFYSWKEGGNNEHLKDQTIFGRTSLSICTRKSVSKNETHSTVNLLQKMLFNQIRKIPDLARNNENGRKVIHFHAFRKYFRTVVGDAVSRDFAEALIGHHFYMDTYYNQSAEKKREMYLKVEPYLTISDFSKVEKTLQDLSERYKELEKRLAVFERYAPNNSIPTPQLTIKS